jgi:large subunit ribosomal protein L9
MEVVLLENIRKLGSFGEIVNVKNGFARNYLLPRKKAMIANKSNLVVFETKKAEVALKNAEMLADAKKIHTTVNKSFVLLVRQASEEGKLFGSVSSKDVIDQLNTENSISLPKSIADGISSIKFIGVHELSLPLHPEVNLDIRVIVARSEFEAQEAKKAYLNPPKKKTEASEESFTTKNSKKEAVAKEDTNDVGSNESTEEVDTESN